jgi:hypothetical protein
MMTRQQEVIAHLGGALLAAQDVERLVAFAIAAKPRKKGASTLDLFLARPRRVRISQLRSILADLCAVGWTVPNLESALRRFAKDRNKLVHCFHMLGDWDFRRTKDCDACVTFLRGFIDQSSSLQHLFVTALSMRDKHYKTQVPRADADQYERDCKKVYNPLSIRWAQRIDDV